MQLSKQEQVYEAAKLIREASLVLNQALIKIDEYNLNVENYPKNWLDFNEHPDELRGIVVYSSDDDKMKITVNDAK